MKVIWKTLKAMVHRVFVYIVKVNMTLTMGDILHVLFDAVSSLVRLCGGMSLINAWVDSPISGTLHSIKLHFTAVVYLKKAH